MTGKERHLITVGLGDVTAPTNYTAPEWTVTLASILQ